MVKISDTYNPITGEYVKKISDWVDLDGSRSWTVGDKRPDSYRLMLSNVFDGSMDNGNKANLYDYASRKLGLGVNTPSDYVIDVHKYNMFGSNRLLMYMGNNVTGFNNSVAPTSAEAKAYFHGYRMANADGTSPYYKSEVPYTPATWAEWSASGGGVVKDSSGITFTSDGVNWMVSSFYSSLKSSTKYGILYNVVSSSLSRSLLFVGDESFGSGNIPKAVGNQKSINTTISDTTGKKFSICTSSAEPLGNQIKLKDIRIFELPTGSQIEADFTNLSADELSAKYTFNGLCVKHWKKVTDGTGLTSTLPTASYAGYTPYRMIYQLATPEISYLTPKATIPLYDTNTIVETDTPSDCKADVTVGYKLKIGATAVAGDITAPTPDYMSAVNSVSEDGLKKGIVRSPNIVENGNFANGTTGWIGLSSTNSVSANVLTNTADGTLALGVVYRSVPYSGANLYYASAEVRANSLGCTDMRMTNRTNTVNIYKTISSPIQNQWYKLSGVVTNNALSNGIRFYHNYADTSSALGKSMSVKNVIVIDLTATFGAGNEPTQEQCDILFATWQDKASTQATLPTLRKIGTVADTYNPETGVLAQRIGKKVFDGTENWVQNLVTSGSGYRYSFPLPDTNIRVDASTNNIGMAKCSHFNLLDVGGTDYSKTGFTIVTGTLWVYKNGETSTQLKTYLADQYAKGTPVSVYYPLTTPVVTTLTKTALPTYKPTTVIESDSTVKGNVSADYKLKVNATPVAGDFIASPECVNDIKDLGNSIDVVSSVGRRNLLDMSNIVGYSYSGGQKATGRNIYSIDLENRIVATNQSINNDLPLFVIFPDKKENTIVTVSGTTNAIGDIRLYYRCFDSNNISVQEQRLFSIRTINGTFSSTMTLSIPYNTQYINIGIGSNATANYWIKPKLEIGNVQTIWTPAIEDILYNTTTNGVYKTNILLSAPLRSVGDVKDRLFKDSDGKWKIERNVGEKVFDGTESFASHVGTEGEINQYSFTAQNVKYDIATNTMVSSHYKSGKRDDRNTIFDIVYNTTNSISFNINKDIQNVTKFKEFLSSQYANGTPVTVQYQLATPTYETLSQELQTKLDNIPTFPEHNYVYTVTNDNLQPTLHVDYKKLSWLRSRLLVNSLKIYSRNLTDAEMIQNYKVEKERFGM